jgi:hypothetical protein
VENQVDGIPTYQIRDSSLVVFTEKVVKEAAFQMEHNKHFDDFRVDYYQVVSRL